MKESSRSAQQRQARQKRRLLKPLSWRGHDYFDCQPLLNQLFKRREITRDKYIICQTAVLPGLLDLEFDGQKLTWDQAMILSDLLWMDFGGHMNFWPVGRNGRIKRKAKPGWYVNTYARPDRMMGIPPRKYRKAVAKLAELKLISRRPAKDREPSEKRCFEKGDWLLNIAPNPVLIAFLTKITEQARNGEKMEPEHIPWALRHMLDHSGKAKRNTEDGLGTFLVLLILRRHVRNSKGEPRRRTRHKARIWCDYHREEWAKLCHCTERQLDRAIERVSHLLWHDNNGKTRNHRKVLLTPKGRTLEKLWWEVGLPYVKRLRLWPGGAF